MTSAAEPGRSSATSITDPTMPATSLALESDALVLLLDVSDSRATTRAPGIPKDIRQLVRDEQLTRTSAGRAAFHSVALVALWAGSSALGLVAGRWWVWALVWVAQLALVRGAYAAMHDASHGTLFASRTANRAAALAWSVPLLLNASLWRAWHLEHHRATISDEDPEGVMRASNALGYVVVPSLRSIARFAAFHGQSAATLVGRPPAYVRRFGPHLGMRLDALVVLAATVALLAGSIAAPAVVIPVWLAPVLGYWLIGAPFFDLPEHDRTASRGGTLDVSRTVGASAPTRWLLRNGNHHAAHHLVPSVTSSQLPRLDQALGPRTVHRSPSYLRHHVRTLAALLPGRRAA